MTPNIDNDFYINLFYNSKCTYNSVLKDSNINIGTINNILNNRNGKLGLSVHDVSKILTALRDKPNIEIKKLVIKYSKDLRKKLFSNYVSLMVPIELTNYCSSNCYFCGWRSSNKEMARFTITNYAIDKQFDILYDMGFRHFELVGGDDIQTIKQLPDILNHIRSRYNDINSEIKISLCMTPLLQNHYKELKKNGLDAVFNWQETYDKNTFNKHITNGPKALGIDTNYRINKNGNGFLYRIKSQEYALNEGLQIGIGVMFLLSNDIEADILSLINHGKKLIDSYKKIPPIIIGMPIWNPITTQLTDNYKSHIKVIDIEREFEFIAAIYLLSFPDNSVWVFPNCRVKKQTQINTIIAAGCFSSTMVRVGPGAYLNFNKENIDEVFRKTSISKKNINAKLIIQSEQFKHYFYSHNSFLLDFKKNNIEVVDENKLLCG